MTLFSNLLTFSEATHVMNMFILEGETYIVELLLHIMKKMALNIVNLNSQFDIQQYMSKQMFDDAMRSGNFYPDIE